MAVVAACATNRAPRAFLASPRADGTGWEVVYEASGTCESVTFAGASALTVQLCADERIGVRLDGLALADADADRALTNFLDELSPDERGDAAPTIGVPTPEQVAHFAPNGNQQAFAAGPSAKPAELGRLLARVHHEMARLLQTFGFAGESPEVRVARARAGLADFRAGAVNLFGDGSAEVAVLDGAIARAETHLDAVLVAGDARAKTAAITRLIRQTRAFAIGVLIVMGIAITLSYTVDSPPTT